MITILHVQLYLVYFDSITFLLRVNILNKIENNIEKIVDFFLLKAIIKLFFKIYKFKLMSGQLW